MISITRLPLASNCHQLMLAFPAHHKLHTLPGLVVLVGVLCMQHLWVDPTHQDHLQPINTFELNPLIKTTCSQSQMDGAQGVPSETLQQCYSYSCLRHHPPHSTCLTDLTCILSAHFVAGETVDRLEMVSVTMLFGSVVPKISSLFIRVSATKCAVMM